LPPHLFGEGITIYKDRIIQLTWKYRLGFVYDKAGFNILQKFVYPTEGWGITHDGSHLIMSDGTSTLYFLDPERFKEVRRITVSDRGKPVKRLNELEYINGEVYANIWTTDRIAKVDPTTGLVNGWIDLRGLLGNGPGKGRRVGELNGVAYDRQEDRIFVTGKLWPRLFEIRIVPLQ
jgi:glutamine cyclotransferase